MQNRARAFVAFAALICLLPAAALAITPYTQSFETLNIADPNALGNDGWLVFGNVSTPGGDYLYGYGPFAAPNTGAAFSAIVTGQGGAEQGFQQLSVYSDYENGDHANGNIIESNVFQEQTIGAGDLGNTWVFSFEAKMGNLAGASTAEAFIKTLDPDNGFALTNFVSVDMTSIPETWEFYTLELYISASLEGQIIQFGFLNTASNYESSGIFYDNVSFVEGEGTVGLLPYAQDFELLNIADPSALANDGWLVFGNVSTPGGDFLYGYGPFDAPNTGAAFCAIAAGEGGAEQGFQQLSVYSDYENLDHASGNIIESNVFQEQVITAGDVGTTWIFAFDAKRGNITGASTAAAFIKTIDPNDNFNATNFITNDMTNIVETWQYYAVEIYIIEELVGQFLQFGFLNTASNYESSGIYYDNLNFFLAETTAAPVDPALTSATLKQNFPNPFNPKTRIEFSLETAGPVSLAVFDLMGRRVTTLQQGEMAAGDHAVTWNGLNARGNAVAGGQYWYVLRTEEGQLSRRMTLLK